MVRHPRGRFARAGRRTNVALLWLIIAAIATGWVAFATARGVPAVLAAGGHGLFGSAILVLAPWKNAILRRSPRLRPMGVLLIALTLICLGSGFVQLFAGYVVVAGLSPIQLHVGSAVAVVPVLVWHVLTHRRQRPRRTDASRRTLVRGAAGLVGAGLGVVALTGASQLSAGGARRPAATGSRPVDPAAIPPTIWLFDPVPQLDDATHRIRLPHAVIAVAQLSPGRDVRARLDCTSGWFADATWTGRSLAELIPPAVLGSAASVVVRSVTGFTRAFPVADLERLWLVTASGGEPLDDAHGGPVRLVAPGYRGFCWVKWVDSVELGERPAWAQLPFPLG